MFLCGCKDYMDCKDCMPQGYKAPFKLSLLEF